MAAKSPPANGYRTSDLYFAAYLRVAGIPLLDTVRDEDEQRLYFVFEAQEAGVFRDLKQQYFNGRAKVSALAYGREIKDMKSLAHM